jgi:hypothetical protein
MLRLAVFPVVIACVFVGCAKSDLVAINGTVTVDGQPLATGTIQFAPIAGDFPSEASRITSGSFSASLHRTKYKVEIYAPREAKIVAKLDERGPGGGPTMEETLPPRYNVQSGLTLDVSGPRSDVQFDLKTR